jgi:hypothetical protein
MRAPPSNVAPPRGKARPVSDATDNQTRRLGRSIMPRSRIARIAAGGGMALGLLETGAGGDPMEKELHRSRGNDNEGSSGKALSSQQRGLARSESVLSPVLLPFASPFLLMRRLMEDLDDLVDRGSASLSGRRRASPARDSGGATAMAWVLEITIPAPPRPQGRTIEIQEGSQDKAAH